MLHKEHLWSTSALTANSSGSSERWTLGKLRKVVAGFVTLPPSMTKDLIALRNAVVHKSAKEPTDTESKAMLAAASDLVAIANPIDDPAAPGWAASGLDQPAGSPGRHR